MRPGYLELYVLFHSRFFRSLSFLYRSEGQNYILNNHVLKGLVVTNFFDICLHKVFHAYSLSCKP